MKPNFEIIKLNEQPWYVAEDNAEAREFASPRNSRAQKMSIAEIKIPAGVHIIEHHHEVMEEIYFVQSGSGIMNINGLDQKVEQGDTIVILPGERHSIRNNTNEDLYLIVSCTPPWTPECLKF